MDVERDLLPEESTDKDYMSDQPSPERVMLGEHDVDLLSQGGLQVLSALMGNPTMTKQLAVRLNLNRARVQFIIDKLIQRGLVCVYKEVHEAERLEVYYTTSSKDLSLALSHSSALNAQTAAIQIILSSLQTHVLNALNSPASKSMTTLKLVQCRMDTARAKMFMARLEALAKEFDAAQIETTDEEFAITLALYPVLYESST